MRISLLFAVVVCSFVGELPMHAQPVIDNLTDFQHCIGATGNSVYQYGNVCHLVAGTYVVDGTSTPTLNIGRNVFVEGETGSGLDTFIRRGNSTVGALMIASSNIAAVIQDLTFDGNRAIIDNNCSPGNADYTDLDLSGTNGTMSLQFLDFINAPGTALLLNGYGSAISYSNFGQRGPQSATRSTAIWDTSTYGGVYSSHISYAGTAAINLEGANERVYENWLTQNRYENPPGGGGAGGQLYVGEAASSALIANNVIDGMNWVASGYVNGCSVSGTIGSDGIEVYGSDHSFYNNEVRNHQGSGMVLFGTQAVVISGSNPFDPTGPQAIENNLYSGIGFHDFYHGASNSNPTLDHIRSFNNGKYGIELDYVSGSPGFQGGSCMYGNVLGNVENTNSTLANMSPNPISCP